MIIVNADRERIRIKQLNGHDVEYLHKVNRQDWRFSAADPEKLSHEARDVLASWALLNDIEYFRVNYEPFGNAYLLHAERINQT